MNQRLIVHSLVGLAMILAITSLASAQHGGHGGGHGGGGHGGGGHGGGHYGGGHGGGHYGGGHYGGGHYGGGHGGGHYGGYGHGGYGHGGGGHGHFGHHYYPHFDFYLSPWYIGYGHSSYDYPYYYGINDHNGNHDHGAAGGASDDLVQQAQPNPTPRVAAKPVASAEGLEYQQRAEAAFRAGDFGGATRLANHALVETPRDGKLLLFTSQTLLAVGDYRSASAAVHQAIALLDTNQWGYVVENYRRYYRGRAYIEQMDRLNKFIKKNPNAAHAYFLRGYQHGFLGHREAAIGDLTKAFELEKRDQLAARLIKHFGGTPPADSTPDPGGPPALKDDGHKGHKHGSHKHGGKAQSVRSNDGHDHKHGDDTAVKPPTSSVPSAPPLLTGPNVPVAVSDKPAPKSPLAALSKLSPTDRDAALAQRTCPVTGDILGADGTPIKVQIGGREIFVCCKGCVADLRKSPGKYLTAPVSQVNRQPKSAKTKAHADKHDHSGHSHDH